jgi:L-alanine-DL-glutamate epimerase-like enolase superfamily enzyme
MAHAISHLGVQYIEQPLRMRSIHELAVLRRRSPVPIGANQASWLNWDILDIVREQAADVIMTDPWQAGGIGNFQRAAAICETASLPLVYHSFAPLSIATRAAMTVLCSSSACIYANQTYNHMTADDVVREPIQIIDGHIDVLDKPGLAVEIDREKLDRYHEAFLSSGYSSCYGNVDKPASEAFFIPNQ